MPYDVSKLDECLAKVYALPPAPLELRPAIDCPDDQLPGEIKQENQPTDYWLVKAKDFRLLGYIKCSNRILDLLIKKTSVIEKQLDLYVELACNQIYSDNYLKADTIAAKAMKLAEKFPAKHAGTFYIAAYANHRNHRPEQAREQVGEALELARKKGDKYLQIRALSLMGIINRDIFFGASLKAIPDHEQALSLATAIRDTSLIMNELFALALNYGDAGQLNLHFDYILKALDYLERFEDIRLRMRIQNVLCENLLRENRLREAEKLRLAGLRYAEASNSLYAGDIHFRLFEQYMAEKQYEKAEASLNNAKTIFEKAGMTEPNMPGLYEGYYRIAKATGQNGLALQNLEKAYSSVSLHYTQRNAELLSRLETQYRTGEKERLLQEKESLLKTTRRQRTLVISFSVLITLLGGVVLIGFLRQRSARRLLARQHETIKMQAEELKSLENLKSRFFANVSHELRTPLSLMVGPVGSLLKQDYWSTKDKKLLQLLERNGKHLLKLVNEILDLSKLETGRLEVKETVVNFHEYLQPLVAQFSSFGDSERVHLKFDYRADTELNIYLDKDKFEKIAHNFLSNALKFTPAGGKVEFIVEDKGEHLLVRVKDTGPGIHPGDMPYIFDRFYQSKLPDAPVQGGTGIGLSLCKELAQLLEGEVWAESAGAGGSMFFFRFPKNVAPIEAVLTTETPAVPARVMDSGHRVPEVSVAETGEIGKPLILIAEDNADLREYMRTFLGEQFHIVTTENGKAAWEILEARSEEREVRPLTPHSSSLTPDLIISDLMMPLMDGFQLLEKIKAEDDLRHIPFIMLTARADVRVKLRALRIGVDDYLTKPFVEEELKVRIENLLRNYGERQKEIQNTESNDASISDSQPESQKGEFSTLPSEFNRDSIPHFLPDGQAGTLRTPYSEDAAWLEGLENLLRSEVQNDLLSVNWIANKMFVSERQLQRRLKLLTGLAPNQYIREVRLQEGRRLLETGEATSVKEAAYNVNFKDEKYFSSIFLERFGKYPSELMSG